MGGPFNLFVIEDNQADLDLLAILLADMSPKVKLHTARDGAEATDFLFPRGSHVSGRVVPDLILMDLNFPKKEPFELLKEIKADKELCRVPLVALSNSNNQKDIELSYCLGASAFLTKPTNLEMFEISLRRMLDFYFGSCRLATRVDLV